VELCCFNVPLHRIYLKSDLVTGPVIVGVRHNLPFEGDSLLLGNDLAGKKVSCICSDTSSLPEREIVHLSPREKLLTGFIR
jgi:hypothetical protein